MNDYVLLKDYKKEEETLLYSSPCRGLWNIVHLATQVPGSHQIYVCPTSCLRGVVLTTAEMGAMDRLSTITVGEDNILEGNLEEMILSGTRKILHTLKRKPTVVFIFTSCIHHFMAADFMRVYRILRKEFPDIAFIDAYMDPIMRKKTPPLPSLQRQVFRMFENVEKKEGQCSFIDNWFEARHNDLYTHLLKNSVSIKDFAEMKTYEDYLSMQNSDVNFVFHPFGLTAAKDLYYRLHQNYLYMPLSFDYDVIDGSMEKACEMMHVQKRSESDILLARNSVEKKVEHLKSVLNGLSVAIDHSAIDMPFSLALFLEERGIHVSDIFLEGNSESEDVIERLKKLNPDIRIYNPDNCMMRKHVRKCETKTLAIGQQAGYFLNTPYFVNQIFTAEMYGYEGIVEMMDRMEKALHEEKDIESLVSIKGWRCHVHG